MSISRPAPERVVTYEAVQASREFRQVNRRFRRFAVPTLVGVLCWYFLYVALAAFFPELMAVRLFGKVNLGLCLGLAQFASTFAVTTLYLRWARTTLDPMVDRLREQLERGGVR